tara:strand:- start:1733 stop:3532 length:1800 start_codon:yes stop_codon:yes gene_type:complete
MFANISCYKFAHLSDLKLLKAHLLAACKERNLKGTILLSLEGINLFIAGPRMPIDEVVAIIRAIPGLEGLAPKYSESDHQPFNRMLVRLKKEIIAFGVDGIDPAVRTSPKLKATELKQWLDDGKPVTLLDTRNDYEVKLGTFKGAVTVGIDSFRDFPGAVAKLPEDLKDQPIVMFCTGGIRCEKAGPYMEREGFKEIYQLDGGILKYFEEVGADHYDGECFVFDQRVGVDPALRESESTQCYQCQTPLTAEEQDHPHYQPPNSCPHCYVPDAEKERVALAERQAKLDSLINPLPGSVPYDNRRPFTVPGEHDGATLGAALLAVFPHLSREHWQTIVDEQRMVDSAEDTVTLNRVVRAGEYYAQLKPATTEPAVDARVRLLYGDEAIVVLSKPSPLPMHPGGRFKRNTLDYLLTQVYSPHHPRPAHRLDANTSGLVVCSRTRRIAGLLQPQFTEGKVEKTYLARVHGKPTEETFSCATPIGTEVGPSGNRQLDPVNGKPARTEFKLLSYRETDDTSLLSVKPITGRTHQIRLHLQSLGHPIVGDPIYGNEPAKPGDPATLPPTAPPLCLHSWKLSFEHPISRERVVYEDQKPDWVEWFSN